jgi:hypothetical protein
MATMGTQASGTGLGYILEVLLSGPLGKKLKLEPEDICPKLTYHFNSSNLKSQVFFFKEITENIVLLILQHKMERQCEIPADIIAQNKYW